MAGGAWREAINRLMTSKERCGAAAVRARVFVMGGGGGGVPQGGEGARTAALRPALGVARSPLLRARGTALGPCCTLRQPRALPPRAPPRRPQLLRAVSLLTRHISSATERVRYMSQLLTVTSLGVPERLEVAARLLLDLREQLHASTQRIRVRGRPPLPCAALLCCCCVQAGMCSECAFVRGCAIVCVCVCVCMPCAGCARS
jgi:hypothetical protein